MTKKQLTDEEVEWMLKQLRSHFNEPVMPLHHFCRTMEKWIDCIKQGLNDPPDDDYCGRQQGKDYEKHLRHIYTDILKSNLLVRMFYGGEEPRTVKCPLHKGHWSGCEGIDNICPHGCQLTGWLPNG